MNAKSVETHPTPHKGRRWTVPQALVWIVSRSENDADNALGLKFLAELPPLRLNPTSPNDDPPIPLAVAPGVFLQAARVDQIAVFGWECGKGESLRVPVGNLRNPELKPRDGAVAIVEDITRPWEATYWSGLSVRADECMKRWPGLVDARGRLPISPRRKPGVPEKNDSNLIDKVRRDMNNDGSLTLYAAVQRHCGEKTRNAVEAAYKRVNRKIGPRDGP